MAENRTGDSGTGLGCFLVPWTFLREGECLPRCCLRWNGRPDLKRDSPQVPGLTFQKRKLEPYESPSPALQSDILPAPHWDGTCALGAQREGRTTMGEGSRWLRAQHSCWVEPPASLMGVNNCRGFAGGDQSGEITSAGPSLAGPVPSDVC